MCNLHYQRARTYGDPLHPGVLDRRSWAEKFEARVQKGSSDECWNWVPNGRVNHKFGYGMCTDPRDQHKSIGAHRAAYLHWVGPLEKREVVMHLCDNPPCCNPSHLRKGSMSDNLQDMLQKGRNTKGEAHPKAKLSEDDVRDIRRRYGRRGEGKDSIPKLAAEYGIATSTCYSIISRKIWREVE